MKATRDNLFTDGARGTTRNMTISKRQSGQHIISARRGKSAKAPTPAMAAVREKFKIGIIYGRKVMDNAELKAVYAKRVRPDMNAYTLAVTDAIKPPKIVSINASDYTGKAGEPIVVRAIDDFKVAGVKVAIYSAAGVLLEKADAIIQENDTDWLYTTTTANEPLAGSKILATAVDLPGNTGSLEVTL